MFFCDANRSLGDAESLCSDANAKNGDADMIEPSVTILSETKRCILKEEH